MKTFFLLLVIISFGFMELHAEKSRKDAVQRRALGLYDLQHNTKSNLQFYTSNYGIFGMDIARGEGGGYWPRGSRNQYVFGAGLWIGAKKRMPDTAINKKYVVITYNPNNGRSWFVPGMIRDGDLAIENDIKKYRTYFSTDFNPYTGMATDPDDGPNWPLWNDGTMKAQQFDAEYYSYVHDVDQRNRDNYPRGPLFISDEDISSVFKDTDLNQYDGGAAYREYQGYPLGLEIQSNIYSWNNEKMKDVVILHYLIENKSDDTLKECWIGGLVDIDIARAPNTSFGAPNDRVNYYDYDESLNFGYAWTNLDRGERGYDFGYVGVSLLETPTVDEDGYIRDDKAFYEPEEQLGLKSFINWSIEDDPDSDVERYEFLASGDKDADNGPGDKRIMITTGPFHLRPGDMARFAISINFAMPAKGGEADGTYEDITGLTGPLNKNKKDGIQAVENSLVGRLVYARNEYYKAFPLSVDNNPSGLASEPVFPNPVSSHFNVSYKLEKNGQFTLSLYNQLGEEILVLEDSYKTAGNYTNQYSLRDKGLSNGVYYLRIITEDGILTRKMIVIK